jgi:DNA mismatch repair protein MutS2
MENASLEFDRESLAPTYRFLQGVPGSSEALSIARRLGFPQRLVDEAREALGGDKEAIESLLQDLQQRRRLLEEAQREIDEERAELVTARDDVTRRLSNIREERERLKREALEDARRLVERSKAELTELLGAVKADGANGKAAGRARTRLGEMGRDFERGLADGQPSAEPARPATPEEIEDGTPVLIPRMGWKGTALGPPGTNGKVSVSVGSLRVDIAVGDLEIRGPAP